MESIKFKTIDEYHAAFPENVSNILESIRQTIKNAAPQAEEGISYNMPAFKLNGILVYYAAYKNHIGLYATPTGHDAFKKELSIYKSGKGSVQFPLDQPMPLDLIARMVMFKVNENLGKAKEKKKK